MSDTQTETSTSHVEQNESQTLNYSAHESDETSREEWNRIEKRFSEFNRKVMESATKYAQSVINKTNSFEAEDNMRKLVLGDEYYALIRPKFVKSGLLEKNISLNEVKAEVKSNESGKKKEKKEKKVVIDKKVLFKMNNTRDKILQGVEKIAQSYSFDVFQPFASLNSSYIELVGMGFIYMSVFMIKHKETYKKDKKIKEVWSMMVSMQRCRDACQDYQGIDPVNPTKKKKISQMFVADITDAYEKIRKVFPFDGIEIFTRVPELLVYAKFDEYVGVTTIKPRDHQKELINKVYENFNKGFFIVYNAMIGSGKTTSVGALSDITKSFGKILLCVCNIATVRYQMCNLLYNNDASFAIGYQRIDGTVKLSHTWSKRGQKLDVIVCDPVTACKLLADVGEQTVYGDKKQFVLYHGDLEQFVLFHDEPTVGADTAGSLSLRENVSVQLNLPPRVIYSSATAPSTTDQETVINLQREKNSAYPNLVVDTVYSPTVQVGSEVRTESGELVVPYLGCKTSEDLLTTIKKIQDIPFLGRMLTTEVALHLWNQLKSMTLDVEIPNIPVMFGQVKNLKADKIREVVLEMLTIISNLPQPDIERLCSSKLIVESINSESEPEVKEKKEDESSDDGFEWDKPEPKVEIKKINSEISITNLGTTHVWSGMTLIVSTDPVNYALTNFKGLIDRIHGSGIKTMGHVLSHYDKEHKEWEKKKEATLDNLKMSEKDKAFEEANMEKNEPKLKFPKWAQIGTVEHIKEFKTCTNPVDTRSPMNIECLASLERNVKRDQKIRFVKSTKVQDEILMLLFCGVGVYSPSNTSIDKMYTELVAEYADAGLLAYVIADGSITYGTDQPYGCTIVDDGFAKCHSIQTLFQLMGRAGRVGKFPRAKAIVGDYAGRMIVDFTVHPERYNVELTNIMNMVDIIKNEQQQKILSALAKMEQELALDQTETEPETELIENTQNITSTETIIQKEKSNVKKEIEVPDSWEDLSDSDNEEKDLSDHDNEEKDLSNEKTNHSVTEVVKPEPVKLISIVKRTDPTLVTISEVQQEVKKIKAEANFKLNEPLWRTRSADSSLNETSDKDQNDKSRYSKRDESNRDQYRSHQYQSNRDQYQSNYNQYQPSRESNPRFETQSRSDNVNNWRSRSTNSNSTDLSPNSRANSTTNSRSNLWRR